MMKAVIFTEAGRGIGLGHLSRCSAIAEAFRDKGIRCELLVHADATFRQLVRELGGEVQFWLHKSQIRRQVSVKQGLAVVDSYVAGREVLQEIQKENGLTCYIDDDVRLNYPKGLVINGSLGAENLGYKANPKNTFFLGVSWIPLRRPFWHVPAHVVRQHMRKVLITCGGADESNMTSRILALVQEHHPHLENIVVVGHGFQHQGLLLRHKSPETQFVLAPDAEQMSRLMLQADVAISSGGQTLYELARCGLPAVVLTAADNQKHQVAAWAKTGLFINAGSFRDRFLDSHILQGLEKVSAYTMRLRSAQQGPRIVDGQGALRFVTTCLKSYVDQFIEIHPVTDKDKKNVWVLSNHPEVRRNSFQTRMIAWEDHQQWFSKTLEDRQMIFLAAYAGDDLLGHVRASYRDREATISIAVNPVFHHCGVGKTLLGRAVDHLRERKVKTVFAWIKDANRVSTSFFRSSGFRKRFNSHAPKGRHCMQFSVGNPVYV